MTEAFLPLINLGGAVAVTAMFLLFLYKRGEKTEELVKEVTEKLNSSVARVAEVERNCHQHNEALGNAFLRHNEQQSNAFMQAVERYHAEMATTIKDQLDVARDSTKAMVELTESLRAKLKTS